MKERGSIKVFLILIVIITIASGVVAFKIADRGNKDDVDTLEANEKSPKSVNEAKNELESKENSHSVFDGVENIYIQNPNIPTNMVEITDKDRSFIVANFKSITKIISTLGEVKKSVIDLSKYEYQISVPVKNTKINLYRNPAYIVFEVKNNIEEVYSVNEEQIDTFIKIIEEKYIGNTLSTMLKSLPSQMHIEARDKKSTYVLNNKEIKEIMGKLRILSLEDNGEYIDIPAIYPDYNINIQKDDKEYNLNLINEETMIIESPMIYLYCKYDGELWQYIQDKLPIQMDFKENELGYLFNSERVIVNDAEGVYNMQNSTYYNLIIPRWINKVEPQRIDKEAESIEEENLKFTLEFLIKDKWKEVLIYDNYIIYGEELYFSKNISETIKSLLMVP